MKKILGFRAEVQELLTFFQSHCSLPTVFKSSCFLIPEQKESHIQTFLKVGFCPVINITSIVIQSTARGGLLLSFASDFGERLEILGLLWKHLEFFAYPASMQGMQKKGRV